MSPQHQWRYTNSSFIVWGTWTGCSCRTHVAKEVQSCNWWPLTLTLFPSRLSSKIWFTPWLFGINQACHRSFGLLCRIRIILMRTRFEQEPRRIKSDVRKIWFFNVVLQCIALTIDWIIRHLCLVGVIGLAYLNCCNRSKWVCCSKANMSLRLQISRATSCRWRTYSYLLPPWFLLINVCYRAVMIWLVMLCMYLNCK